MKNFIIYSVPVFSFVFSSIAFSSTPSTEVLTPYEESIQKSKDNLKKQQENAASILENSRKATYLERVESLDRELGRIDVCPNLDGDQNRIPSGRIMKDGECVFDIAVTDVCSNINGVQSFVPLGFLADGGLCIKDVCNNIDGLQSSMPVGLVDLNGSCVQDICSNIAGVQPFVPTGMVNENGFCVSQVSDSCLNIAGIQLGLPEGLTKKDDGTCVKEACVVADDFDNTNIKYYSYLTNEKHIHNVRGLNDNISLNIAIVNNKFCIFEGNYNSNKVFTNLDKNGVPTPSESTFCIDYDAKNREGVSFSGSIYYNKIQPRGPVKEKLDFSCFVDPYVYVCQSNFDNDDYFPFSTFMFAKQEDGWFKSTAYGIYKNPCPDPSIARNKNNIAYDYGTLERDSGGVNAVGMHNIGFMYNAESIDLSSNIYGARALNESVIKIGGGLVLKNDSIPTDLLFSSYSLHLKSFIYGLDSGKTINDPNIPNDPTIYTGDKTHFYRTEFVDGNVDHNTRIHGTLGLGVHAAMDKVTSAKTGINPCYKDVYPLLFYPTHAPRLGDSKIKLPRTGYHEECFVGKAFDNNNGFSYNRPSLSFMSDKIDGTTKATLDAMITPIRYPYYYSSIPFAEGKDFQEYNSVDLLILYPDGSRYIKATESIKEKNSLIDFLIQNQAPEKSAIKLEYTPLIPWKRIEKMDLGPLPINVNFGTQGQINP